MEWIQTTKTEYIVPPSTEGDVIRYQLSIDLEFTGKIVHLYIASKGITHCKRYMDTPNSEILEEMMDYILIDSL